MEEQIKNIEEDEIIKKLKSLKINISVNSEALNGDKGIYDLLIEGANESNYEKVYHFVHSVEIGCGFHSSETLKIQKIYDKAFEINMNEVISILNAQNSVIDVVIHCYSIQDKYKLQLLKSPILTNELVVFELIRQLLNDIHQTNIIDHKSIISFGMNKLASTNTDLFKYLIKKFEYKKQLYYLMDIALTNMNAAGRKAYANTITISMTNNEYRSLVNMMLKNMANNEFDLFIEDIKEIIYNRWNDYLDSLLMTKEFMSDIFINSYSDLILNCLAAIYKDVDLFYFDLDMIITNFNSAIYDWYGKTTELNSIYNIYSTKLFYLKEVQKYNGISIDNRIDIIRKMNNLFDNNTYIHNKYQKDIMFNSSL